MTMMAMARLFLLSLGLVCLSEAWVSTTARRSIQASTTGLGAGRKFAQPNSANRRSFAGDSKLVELYDERIKTAGRKGTKRFMDPCKVFVGNLPFDVDEKQLKDFVLRTMGQTIFVMHSVKVIREWKTGKSKGYGFCLFTDPIYATLCMDQVNGKMLAGRAVTVSQGKKKEQDNQLYVKKEKKAPVDAEEEAIAFALDQAESDDEDGIPTFGGSDDTMELDALLFGLESDDDDDDVDGIFLENKNRFEDVDSELNREQRREAQRKLKRKKMPHKGFGSSGSV